MLFGKKKVHANYRNFFNKIVICYKTISHKFINIYEFSLK